MAEGFTIFFEGDVRQYAANPFQVETPFGRAQIVGIGNAFDERDVMLEALYEIAHLPEQGGCDSDVDAVEMWMLMQKRAKAAIDLAEGVRPPEKDAE